MTVCIKILSLAAVSAQLRLTVSSIENVSWVVD